MASCWLDQWRETQVTGRRKDNVYRAAVPALVLRARKLPKPACLSSWPQLGSFPNSYSGQDLPAHLPFRSRDEEDEVLGTGEDKLGGGLGGDKSRHARIWMGVKIPPKGQGDPSGDERINKVWSVHTRE